MLTTPASASPRASVLVVAPDVVGATMAGPGLRTVNLAVQLSNVADVRLAVGIAGSDAEALAGRGFTVAPYETREQLVALVEAADVVFCQLIDPSVVEHGLRLGRRFIFDLYNALPAEAIGSERIGGFEAQPEKDREFVGVTDFFRFCMRAGSYFVTSNERQRDFWIGFMIASGGLLPSELAGRTVEDLIGLVPFGVESGEPTARRHGLRGTRGISDDHVVALWAGGIWDWFDAETPIRAVAELATEHPELKLVFYGTTHPNAMIGTPPAVARARALASELGVLGSSVHFIEGWVPSSERADFLLDADVAVSGHLASFETRYAFRTRILDHFWAGLPSLVTEGDWFAEYIESESLGVVVPYRDVRATRRAFETLLDPSVRAGYAQAIAERRDDWRWSRTSRDLLEVVADWQDRLVARPPVTLRSDVPTPTSGPAPWRSRARRVLARTWIGHLYRGLGRR